VVTAPTVSTSGDVLLGKAPFKRAVITDTTAPGVYLLPATGALLRDEVELGRSYGGEQRLRNLIADLPASLGITRVIIDCAGAMNTLGVSALVAATSVVTVTAADAQRRAALATRGASSHARTPTGLRNMGGAHRAALQAPPGPGS